MHAAAGVQQHDDAPGRRGNPACRAAPSVILLSADLRRPELEQLFGIPAGTGFATALAGDNGVSPALVADRL